MFNKKLNKTWILDLDGTIVIHNGHLLGQDTIISKSKEFINSLDSEDIVIITTGREEKYREQTELFLKNNGIRYHYIIFGLPLGERILINDQKPSGMKTAYAYNIIRNIGIEINSENND